MKQKKYKCNLFKQVLYLYRQHQKARLADIVHYITKAYPKLAQASIHKDILHWTSNSSRVKDISGTAPVILKALPAPRHLCCSCYTTQESSESGDCVTQKHWERQNGSIHV